MENIQRQNGKHLSSICLLGTCINWLLSFRILSLQKKKIDSIYCVDICVCVYHIIYVYTFPNHQMYINKVNFVHFCVCRHVCGICTCVCRCMCTCVSMCARCWSVLLYHSPPYSLEAGSLLDPSSSDQSAPAAPC